MQLRGSCAVIGSTSRARFAGVLPMSGCWRSVVLGILVLLCCSVEGPPAAPPAAPSAACRASVLNSRCCSGGVENPCTHTVEGFLRSRDPCGLNGTCTQLSARNEAASHQFEYKCVCDLGFTGSRCSKCDHGLTWSSGCRGASASDP